MADLSEILQEHLEELATDPFGNFSVQQMLEMRPELHSSFFEHRVLPRRFQSLCKNKFASNVIDKVIRNCTKLQLKSLLEHLADE